MMANQGQAASFKLSAPEVLASVRSLYADELKPFGRVLLKRLRERAAATVALAQGLPLEAVDPETMPRIDPKRLRRMCQTCPQLRVDPEDGREFSVTLVGRPCNFLDVCSPHDPYPPEMWLDAATYFQSLSEEEMHLPGGRYACARVLVGRGLPFLAGCSLGQVCHIVQLAISQKRILGYLEGQLVPYWHSEEWVKEQYAFHQQPICSRKGTNSLPLATWEEARERLLQLLDSESNPEPGVVTLSNVKRLFRSRFQLELSETVLGHSRLFDLLHDVRFRDVCTVQAHGNGQLLVKRAEGPRHIPCHQLGLTNGEVPYYQETWDGSGCAQQAPGSPAQAPPGVWNHVFMGSMQYPQASIDMSALPPNLSMLREAEIDLGMENPWQGLSPGASPRDSHDGSCPSPWANSHHDMADFCMKFHEEDSGGNSTDTPFLRDAPFLSGWSSDEAESVPPLALQAEQLGLQAEEIRAEEEAAAVSRNLRETLKHWGPVDAQGDLTEVKGSPIKNTFIDIQTRHAGSKKRLSSVPKDLFSKKSVLETTCHALLSPSPKHRPAH